MFTNSEIATLLKNILFTSVHPEFYDDDIQPSKRQRYDANRLADKISLLIEMLNNTGERK